jgi:hypothetical protein
MRLQEGQRRSIRAQDLSGYLVLSSSPEHIDDSQMHMIAMLIVPFPKMFLEVELAALNALIDVVVVCCWIYSKTDQIRLCIFQAPDLTVPDTLCNEILNNLLPFVLVHHWSNPR